LCPAGTNAKLQVQLVNLGNTIVEQTAVAVTDVPSLTCSKGLNSDTDAHVLSSGASVALPADLGPTEQVVCQGTFLFTQAVIDTEQEAKVFTPTATTTCGAAKDNAALPSGDYAATASIAVAPPASLVVNIVTSACTVPSIIAVGASSELLQLSLLSCCRSGRSGVGLWHAPLPDLACTGISGNSCVCVEVH
jgi:hypothetical protein